MFFEFVKGLESFELRNGLDHYRIRPRRGQANGSTDDPVKEGATILHLGPMLKAAITFYV